MEKETFQLLLDSKTFNVPSIFKHMLDISPKIVNILIFNKNHQYQVESKVSENVFQSFLKYLINDDIPDIQIYNFNEYLQLSKEFQILDDIIKAKSDEFGEYFINLNALNNIKNTDLSDYEEQVALNLDDYLEKYGKELMNAPIQSLVNIFNHKKRKLTQHDLAYNLIGQHYENSKNFEIFVLLDSLDGSKLSKSNLEESFSLYEFRMNHMPAIEFSYISNSFQNQRKLEDLVTQLDRKLNENEMKREEEMKTLIEKNEAERKALIKDTEDKIKELIKMFEDEKKLLMMQHEKDIKNLNEKIDLLSKQINEQSQNISTANSFIDDVKDKLKDSCKIDESNANKLAVLSVDLNINEKGILGKLKEMEKSPFDRLFIASQSSRDIYNLIDPKTKDDFRFFNISNSFIEFCFENEITINGIQIFSSFEYFPKSFKIEIDGCEVISINEANELNGPNKSMTVPIDPISGRKLRFIQTGPNWDKGDNYLRIKRIEILSSDMKYSEGVFSSFIKKSENHDPHKCPVIITSSYFDLNKYFLLETDRNICTYDKENSWFQIELTKGMVIIEGFRLGRCQHDIKMKNYTIKCTDDISKPYESWIELIQIDEKEENEHKITDIYELNHPSPPSKFIRIQQTGKNWGDDYYLAFYSFDIYGSYS